MTKSSACLILAALLSGIAFHASAAPDATSTRLYKWVDEKGETHYGEVIPPEYAGRNAVQLDSKGREIRPPQPVAASSSSQKDTALLAQRRKDKMLLNSYSNEREIDLARDRNLQQIDQRMDSIKQLQKTAQDKLNEYNQELGKLQKFGQPIPPSLQSDINTTSSRLEGFKQEMVAEQQKADTINANFEADKARYRVLTSGKPQ